LLLALPCLLVGGVQAAGLANQPSAGGLGRTFAAGAPPELRALSLRQALDLALERNLQVALSFEQVDQARSALVEARSALGPTVRLTGSQSNQTTNLVAQGFPKPGLGPALFPTLDGPFNSFDARLRFSQAIFDPERSHLARAGERRLAEAEHQRLAVQDQLLAATALAYIDAQQQTATLDAATGNLGLSQDLLKLAQDQQQSGVATGVDVARAETRVAQDRYVLTQAGSGREQALLRLRRLLGVPSGEALTLATPLEYRDMPLPALDAAVASAEGARQELQVLDERIAAAQEALGAAQSEGLPVVSIEAGLGPSGATPSDTVYLTRSIGIGVSVPLFTGGLLDAHRDRARSQLRMAELSREDARRQVEEDVHLALLDLATAGQQVSAARTSLKLGERLLELARDRFAAGVADNFEVIDALNATTTARSQLIGAIAAHSAARANLEAALGTIRSFGL
jgi:outer membrane protein TolC